MARVMSRSRRGMPMPRPRPRPSWEGRLESLFVGEEGEEVPEVDSGLGDVGFVYLSDQVREVRLRKVGAWVVALLVDWVEVVCPP
jgi:hypothetical protein